MPFDHSSPGVRIDTPPLIPRSELASGLLDALASPHYLGAVLVGQRGAGKTTLVQSAVSGANVDVLPVRGSALLMGVPLGTLGFLLGELDVSVREEPVLLLQTLTRRLRDRGRHRQLVLVVDNADEVDELSAMIISQLALNRTVRLVVICQNLDACHDDFLSLWHEGWLRRIDVDGLSQAEAGRMLQALLKEPPTRAAVTDLWHATEGNPRLLQLLAQEYVHAGRLKSKGGFGVLTSAPVTHGPQLTDAVTGPLTRLHRTEHELLELVALCGFISLPLLLRLEPSDALSRLEDQGLLEIGSSERRNVRFACPLTAEVIAGQVGLRRRAELLYKIRQECGEDALPPVSAFHYAAWCLDCAVPLPAEVLLRVAGAANEALEPDLALRFASAVPGYPAHPGAVLEIGRAYAVRGEPEAAAAAIEHFRTTLSGPAPVAMEVALLLLEAHIRRTSAERSAALQQAEALLAPGPKEHGGRTAARLSLMVQLGKAELAADEGKYRAVTEMLGADRQTWRDAPVDLRLQADALRGQAWAATDKQDEALELAAALAQALPRSGVSAWCRASVTGRLGYLYMITGVPSDADLTMRGSTRTAGAHDGTAGEVVEGLISAYAGRADEALRHLEPALQQLGEGDPADLAAVAAAAADYCWALQGKFDRTGSHGIRLDLAVSGLTRDMQRRVEYFVALTAGAASSVTDAVSRLRGLAAEQQAEEAYGLELVALSAAVRLGDSSSVDRLLALAAQTQGPFAKLCEAYAKGLAGRDAQLLLVAMNLATESGNSLFAVDIAAAAQKVATASGNRAVLRSVQSRVEENPHVAAVPAVPDLLDALTPREALVARRAAMGASNKEIAEQMRISVRTVEGHLYQIYAKLHVSSRAELAKALASDLDT
jgi:DNA-binding CsgD family transcriptional regulator